MRSRRNDTTCSNDLSMSPLLSPGFFEIQLNFLKYLKLLTKFFYRYFKYTLVITRVKFVKYCLEMISTQSILLFCLCIYGLKLNKVVIDVQKQNCLKIMKTLRNRNIGTWISCQITIYTSIHNPFNILIHEKICFTVQQL